MSEHQAVSRASEIVLTEHTADARWFMTPKDLSRKSGVPVSTVRDAIYRGELQARRFRGRRWLITEEDALRWIDEQSIPNTRSVEALA